MEQEKRNRVKVHGDLNDIHREVYKYTHHELGTSVSCRCNQDELQ